MGMVPETQLSGYTITCTKRAGSRNSGPPGEYALLVNGTTAATITPRFKWRGKGKPPPVWVVTVCATNEPHTFTGQRAWRDATAWAVAYARDLLGRN